MNTQAHTPIPWTVEPRKNSVCTEAYVLRSIKDGDFGHFQGWSADGVTTEEEDKANAELIVRAVNNHAALLDACKLGLAAMIAWGGKCEAQGEMILAKESVVQAEKIRSAISNAS